MEDVGLPVKDDGQVILGVWFESADAEVEIPRRKRDEEIGVGLLLNGDGLCVEAGDLRREHDGCRSRCGRNRNVIDDEFVQRLLNDLSGGCRVDSTRQKSDAELMAEVDEKFAPYVTSDPEVLSGAAVLLHSRVRLDTVIQCFEDGSTPEEVANWYLLDDVDALRRIRAAFDTKFAVVH